METSTGPDAPEVTLYTDGAVSASNGGYASVLLFGSHRREMSGGLGSTTGPRMDLMAAIAGLERLNRRCRVTVISDSEYVVSGVERGWAKSWSSAGWQREEQAVPNRDLWVQLLEQCDSHYVTFRWARDDGTDPDYRRCHDLARQAARRTGFPRDEGYAAQRAVEFSAGVVTCRR